MNKTALNPNIKAIKEFRKKAKGVSTTHGMTQPVFLMLLPLILNEFQDYEITIKVQPEEEVKVQISLMKYKLNWDAEPA